MKKTYNIVNAKKFTTKNNEEKTSWQRIGKLYVNDDGSVFGRIDSIPVGFDGKFSCFIEEGNQHQSAPNKTSTQQYQQPLTDMPKNLPF